jgi:hypothetical protein
MLIGLMLPWKVKVKFVSGVTFPHYEIRVKICQRSLKEPFLILKRWSRFQNDQARLDSFDSVVVGLIN